MHFNSVLPYNELPSLPLLDELETKGVLKAAIRANIQLAKLNVMLAGLPDPLVLFDSLVLLDARNSSEIENIVTEKDLYQYAVADLKSIDTVTREILSYNEALKHGYTEVAQNRALTTDLFIRMARIIKGNQSGIRNDQGTQLRNNSNEVIYTPPEGQEIIKQKLANLQAFLGSPDDGLDPLIKMAVGHYQFEAIQPFSEANGRTANILSVLYLVQQGLLKSPVLYLSKYILENKNDYLQRFTEVASEQNWQGWLLYMINAVAEASENVFKKIGEINTLKAKTDEAVRRDLPKIYSKDLIEVLFRYPYSKRQFLEDAGIAKVKTAGTYLSALEEKGFLTSVDLGKEKLYRNKALIKILDKD